MNAQRQPESELMERELPAPDVGTMLAIQRAEIDGQIATARAFPRSVSSFAREARELVTMDADMAEACIYALPRGTGTNKKIIAGPSARFAEIIQHCFGNNRGGARVVDQDKQFVTAQGTYHDLEKNTQVVMEVKRRITDSYGKTYNADMIGVTGNAAASIAHRNAVLKGIPKALWLPIYEAARMVAVGDVKTLVSRRDMALAWFQNVGVSPEQICERLGVVGVEDIGLDELEVLTGIKTAIRDGSVRPETAFAPEPESTVKAATSAAGMGQVAEGLAARRQKPAKAKNSAPADDPAPQAVPDSNKLRGRIFVAETRKELDDLAAEIADLPDGADKDEVNELYLRRCEQVHG